MSNIHFSELNVLDILITNVPTVSSKVKFNVHLCQIPDLTVGHSIWTLYIDLCPLTSFILGGQNEGQTFSKVNVDELKFFMMGDTLQVPSSLSSLTSQPTCGQCPSAAWWRVGFLELAHI